jgi:hypothetical protein
VVFQASQDFSSTQGHRQWYYQYWDGRTYSDMAFGGGRIWRGPAGTGSLNIQPGGMFPFVGLEPALKWVAPGAGRADIRGSVRKVEAGGDGVRVEVIHNSAVVWRREIAGPDVNASELNLSLDLAAGGALYFRLNGRSDTIADHTAVNPQIFWVPAG